MKIYLGDGKVSILINIKYRNKLERRRKIWKI